MEENKQTQKAGDNSQQFQAGVVNFYNGIDEKRAREICAETYEIAKKDFTHEAIECANSRVQKLEDTLMPKIMEIEGALNSFADPSFQKLLRKAQIAAAASERENDYDLLSELLICRIKKGKKRKTRASISRAVEIIDEVDDDALCGLTTAFALIQCTPLSGKCCEGLDTLENLFSKLIYMELPQNDYWIEHLDILNALRISSYGEMKKAKVFFSERMDGYSMPGIKIQSDSYKQALDILRKANISESILVQNELLDSYVRLPLTLKSNIEDIMLSRRIGATTNFRRTLVTQEEKNALYSVWDLYESDSNVKEQALELFMKEWDKRPSLKKVHLWWDTLSKPFEITHIGQILAHTNAKRCDNTLPELPLPN